MMCCIYLDNRLVIQLERFNQRFIQCYWTCRKLQQVGAYDKQGFISYDLSFIRAQNLNQTHNQVGSSIMEKFNFSLF
ncbi:unnamed protein product [Paramecium octaurelia]|uniref:Uncharacterized protein n=1 Tax=Paramecium octaurelia TaxID=43137 RepID=A0A8S1WS08_PAROT|nr:unnamed protein product [Paramecium octaurelia]